MNVDLCIIGVCQSCTRRHFDVMPEYKVSCVDYIYVTFLYCFKVLLTFLYVIILFFSKLYVCLNCDCTDVSAGAMNLFTGVVNNVVNGR